MRVFGDTGERIINKTFPAWLVCNPIVMKTIDHQIEKHTEFKLTKEKKNKLKQIMSVLMNEYANIVLVEVETEDGVNVVIEI